MHTRARDIVLLAHFGPVLKQFLRLRSILDRIPVSLEGMPVDISTYTLPQTHTTREITQPISRDQQWLSDHLCKRPGKVPQTRVGISCASFQVERMFLEFPFCMYAVDVGGRFHDQSVGAIEDEVLIETSPVLTVSREVAERVGPLVVDIPVAIGVRRVVLCVRGRLDYLFSGLVRLGDTDEVGSVLVELLAGTW